MITEKHELVSARFSDNERLTVIAIWQEPETNELTEEIIQVKENDSAWEHLLKFVSVEVLHENTAVYVKDERNKFVTLVKDIAESEGLLVSKNKASHSLLFDEFNEFIFNADQDKGSLFKLKLSVFERDFVKSFKGRKLKAKLRKAETAIDVYKILFEIKELVENDVSDGSTDSQSDQKVST